MEYTKQSEMTIHALFILNIKSRHFKALLILIKYFKIRIQLPIQNDLKKGIFVTDFPLSTEFTELKLLTRPSPS